MSREFRNNLFYNLLHRKIQKDNCTTEEDEEDEDEEDQADELRRLYAITYLQTRANRRS